MPTLGNTPRPAYVYDTETDTWVPVGVGAHTHDTLYINQNVIDAKGDLLAGTADNSYGRLPLGANGTVLVSDPSTSTGLAWQPYAAQFAAGKNAAINGGFDIWQRGTTFAGNGAFAASYTADRWQVYRGGGSGISTATRIASDLSGFRYFIRVQRPAGDTTTTYLGLWQSLETANSQPYAGKTITLSFYARAGSGMTNSFGLGVALYSGTGIDEPWYSHTGSTTVASSNFVLTTTGGIINGWQRFSITGNVPSNSNELGITFGYNPTVSTASSTDYYDVTGVQLEIGSVATPFSRAGGTIQGELAACQRYYYRHVIGSMQPVSLAFYWSANQLQTTIPFPVTMRSAPTLDATSGTSFYRVGRNSTSNDLNGFALSISSPQAADIYNTGQASGTAGWAGTLYTINAASYIGFASEL
jgi:hypothetical protein